MEAADPGRGLTFHKGVDSPFPGNEGATVVGWGTETDRESARIEACGQVLR
jgi:hypothetical protein